MPHRFATAPAGISGLCYFLFVAALLLRSGDTRADELADAIRQAARTADSSVVRLRIVGGDSGAGGLVAASSVTTGVVVSGDGEIVTSAFAVRGGAATILAETPAGTRHPLKVVATDYLRRIVLLKADDGSWIPPTVPEPGSLQVGQWAVAVGRYYSASQPNLSAGIVSALDRINGLAIQTDARISPVNYGGALTDLNGAVHGILVPLSPRGDDVDAGVEWYDSGIGFAIPLSDVMQSVARMRDGNDLRPGRLGIRLQADSTFSSRVIIDAVQPGGPADLAGMKQGDHVTAVNGVTIGRSGHLEAQVAGSYAGDRLEFELLRDGNAVRVTAELTAVLPRPVPGYLGFIPLTASPAATADVVPLDAAEAATESALLEAGCAVAVADGSPAAVAGLRGQIRIRSIAGHATPGLPELINACLAVRLNEDVAVEWISQDSDDVRTTAVHAASPPDRFARLSSETVDACRREKPKTATTAIGAGSGNRPEEGDVTASGIARDEVPIEDAGRFILFRPAASEGSAPGLVIMLNASESEEVLLQRWQPVLLSHNLVLAIPVNPEQTPLSSEDIPLIMAGAAGGLASKTRIDRLRTVMISDDRQAGLAGEILLSPRSPVRGAVLTSGWIQLDAVTASGRTGRSVLMWTQLNSPQASALVRIAATDLRTAGVRTALVADDVEGTMADIIGDWSLLMKAY